MCVYQYGDTVLIHAVKGNHLDIVRVLLKKYADVDVPGVVSFPPNFFTASSSKILRVLQHWLLAHSLFALKWN